MKEAYMTVSEGETTDTTSGPDEDNLMMRSDDAKPTKKASIKQAKTGSVEEGIKSSDDEAVEDEQPEEKSESVAVPVG